MPELPLPCAPGESPFRIKGVSYRGLVMLVEQRVPGGLDAFCAALGDPRLEAFVRQPFLAASRYDVLPMLPINTTIARLFSRPLAAFARDSATAQARYDARTVYRPMVESRSLTDLAERLPRLGMRYYDFGGYEGVDEGPGHVRIRRTGLPRYIVPWYAPMQAAYMEEVVRLLGAKRAEAEPRKEMGDGSRAGIETCFLDTDVRYWT